MGKSHKTSARTSNSRRPDERAKQVLYENPIFIPHDPEPAEDSSGPADNNSGTGFVLMVGSLFIVLGLWWLAPQWLGATWKQILHFVGQ